MRKVIKLVVGILFVFISCKKIDLPISHPASKIDIYIAGNHGNNHTPFVMKNGEVNFIQIGNMPSDKVSLQDFVVGNGKHYAAFLFAEPGPNQTTGAYTIDQQINYFPSQFGAYLVHLFLQNKDLYVGSSYFANSTIHSKVLKNGVLIANYETYDVGYIVDFVVSGKDIYMIYQDNNYLKNGERFPIVPNDSSRYSITGIAAQQNNVYLTGYKVNIEWERIWVTNYWKNNQEFELPPQENFQYPHKIKVDKNDIYLLVEEGYVQPWGAPIIAYIKNGQRFELEFGETFGLAHDIQIYNGDIYTLITVRNGNELTAKVYKNTTVIASYPMDGFFYNQRLKFQVAPKK